MKYRKKSIIIDAFQLGIHPFPDWFMNAVSENNVILHGIGGLEDVNANIKYANAEIKDVNADIKTLEGVMHANNKDFIIQGVNGEIYPCKPDIFEKTYEFVE